MASNAPSVEQRRSLFGRRVINIVRPYVLGFFVLVGVALAAAIEWSGFQNFTNANQLALLELNNAVQEPMQEAVDTLTAIAGSSVTREYAVLAVDERLVTQELAALQTRLLGNFDDLLRNNPDFLALRYMGRNGYELGAVTQYTVAGPQATTGNVFATDFSFSKWRDDPAYNTALEADAGQVVISRPSLRTDENDQLIEPREAIIQFYAPVSRSMESDEPRGIVQLEMRWERIEDAVRTAAQRIPQLPDGTRVILVDPLGRHLAVNSDQDAPYPLALNGVVPETYPDTAPTDRITSLNEDLMIYVRATYPDTAYTPLGFQTIGVNRVDISTTLNMNWRVLLVNNIFTALSGTHLLALLALFGGALAGLFTVSRMENILDNALLPLKRNAELAQQAAQVTGKPKGDASIFSGGQEENEVGEMVEALSRMSSYTREVAYATRQQIARRVRNVEVAARISRETATEYELDSLIQRSINLLVDELAFYHVQVFFVDDASVQAFLAYSYGEVGKQMLANRHRIQVGSKSVVGMVAQRGKSVVVNDVNARNQQNVHSFNPLLPKTRAEAGFPLFIEKRVIGVLDVQSIDINVFTPEDLPSFELVADQLAIAIHKDRLKREAKARVDEVTTLTRRIARETWEQAQKRSNIDNYFRYNLMEVESQPKAPPLSPAASAAPITIRGEVIGTLSASPAEGQSLTEGDQVILRSVAERVALAIENARLFRETQDSFLEASTLYQMSKFLSTATTLEGVIGAIISGTMQGAVGGQIWMFDTVEGKDKPDKPEWMELKADLALQPRAVASEDLRGLRLRVEDHLLFSELKKDRVSLVFDTSMDSRIDEAVGDLCVQFGAGALVLLPLVALGSWDGVIMIEFPEPRQFSEQEGRIYANLIDQAGTAISNRILTQETENALERNETLYAASRMINSATTFENLVDAVARNSADPELSFGLVLLSADKDESGWPTRGTLVSETVEDLARPINIPYPVYVPANSPLRDRHPTTIADTNPDEPAPTPLIEFMRERGQSQMVLFPMFSGSEPIALFCVSHRGSARELTVDEMEMLRALTGQMSTVLWNRRLLNETAEALDQSTRLYDATRAITRAQEFDDVYEAAGQNLGNPMIGGGMDGTTAIISTHISHIAFYLAEPEPRPDAPTLHCTHVWARSPGEREMIPTGNRISADDAPLGRLTGEGVVYYRDLSRDPTARRWLRAALQGLEPISAIVAPLQSGGKWLGAMICVSDMPNSLDDKYVRFASAVADQVAIAVENKRLFEEAQTEARRAQAEARRSLALAEVGQVATRVGSGDFERNIADVIAVVAESAGYDRWLLMFKESEHVLHRVTFRASGATATTMFETLHLFNDEHSIIDAMRLNRMLTINDPVTYPAFSSYPIEWVQRFIGKHIAVPVQIGGQLTGGLLLGRSLDAEDLDEKDAQFINTLAAQITVAAENRNLFRAVEAEREQLKAILQTLPTGVVVFDPNTFKPVVVNDRVSELLGRQIAMDRPFTTADYDLYRSGTGIYYPANELPIFRALENAKLDTADDVSLIRDGVRMDMYVHAAPIFGANEEITYIVAAFTDITTLRGLENTLQETLRETVAQYQMAQDLASAASLEAVLDVILVRAMLQFPNEIYIALLDDDNVLTVPRSMTGSSPEEPMMFTSVLSSTDTVIIHDVRNDERSNPQLANHFEMIGLNALVSTPLRTSLRETPRGWLIFAYESGEQIIESTISGIESTRDQASTAVDNRLLIAETRRNLEETQVLYRATRALAVLETTTPNDILNIVMENLITPQVTQVLVAILHSEDWYARHATVAIEAGWASSDAAVALTGVELTSDQFPLWTLLASQTVRTVEDVSQDTTLTEDERIGAISLDAQSLVVIPLRVQRRDIGAIWIASGEPRRYSESDKRVYGAFGEQASLSLEAARLLQQTERRALQLQTSAEVSQEASRLLDLDQLLPRLVELIRERFNYDHVQVFLLEEDYAVLRASTGEIGQQMLTNKHRLQVGSRSVIGQVTAQGETVIINDTAEADTVHKPNPLLQDTRSEMAIPLKVKDQVVGALDVQSQKPNAFSEEEIGALTTLAAQISVAIDNATLYDRAQRKGNEMEFLFDLTTTAAAAETLADALRTVANSLREAEPTKALAVAIYMPATYADHLGHSYTVIKPYAVAGTTQPVSELTEVRIGDHSNVLGIVSETSQPSIIHQIEQFNGENEGKYLPIVTEAQAALLMPLTIGNQLVGLIVMEDEQPFAYDYDTLQLMLALTNSLSAIIRSAQLIEEVTRANVALMEADRLKSDFLANMSHELRTPLNSIIGFSRVMLKGIDGPLTDMQEQDLNTIYSAGQHLLGLINDVLDQAKIASGKMDLKLDYIEVKPLIEGVKAIGIGYLKQFEKNLTIVTDVEPGLSRVYADEFRTRQVLQNLLSNAIKFTPEGAVTISAYGVTDEKTGRRLVKIDVTDTGIGIAEKDLPLLFEAFRQVDSSLTRTAGGTGLGLPISKSLIEMQGGDLMVKSQVGVGSTFSITIPQGPIDEASETGDSDAPQFTPTPVLKPSVGRGTGKLVMPSGYGGTAMPDTPGLSLPGSNGGDAPDEASLPPSPPPGSVLGTETTQLPMVPQKKKTSSHRRITYSRKQVLLIADEPELVNQVRRSIVNEGFEITNADNPFIAEAMVGGLLPTLIVMDVNFSSGGGWDLLRRLKERDDTFAIPFVIMSKLPEDAARAYDMGARTFVAIPFHPQTMLDAVLDAEHESSTERILIIDDQPEHVRLLTQLLDRHGNYRVFSAPNGKEGIALVARRRPDLIILDLRMPEMDGFAVLAELRNNFETASIPVIVVTGDVVGGDEAAALEGVHVMHKTDISQEEFDRFISDVKSHLSGGM